MDLIMLIIDRSMTFPWSIFLAALGSIVFMTISPIDSIMLMKFYLISFIGSYKIWLVSAISWNFFQLIILSSFCINSDPLNLFFASLCANICQPFAYLLNIEIRAIIISSSKPRSLIKGPIIRLKNLWFILFWAGKAARKKASISSLGSENRLARFAKWIGSKFPCAIIIKSPIKT